MKRKSERKGNQSEKEIGEKMKSQRKGNHREKEMWSEENVR